MKLNLGAGDAAKGRWLEGYVNIDRSNDAPTVQEAYPLSGYADESCDEVRASHVLEHFSHREAADVLREWIRVLKPGGWLKIAVPNFQWIVERYAEGREDLPLVAYLMGGQVDENDFHKSLYDPGLAQDLADLGLVNVQEWQSEIKDCAALPVSLNLMGQKPYAGMELPDLVDAPPVETKAPRRIADFDLPVAPVKPERGPLPKGEVVGLFSLPRLCFTDTMHCTLNVAKELDITVIRSSGVFWGQCLQNLMIEAIERGATYALTLDYDALFTASDVRELYRIAEETGADALCALQTKRESASPLFCLNTKTGGTEIEIAADDLRKDTFPIVTGHFGLTLIRLSALQTIEKPWFIGRPSETGDYGEGRMDEDIHFWHKWRDAGLQLYLAPKVVIGHLQMVATWPDGQLQARHQYVHDYTHGGKPKWAWR